MKVKIHQSGRYFHHFGSQILFLLIEGFQRNSDFFPKVHDAAAQISLARESETSSVILVGLRWSYGTMELSNSDS